MSERSVTIIHGGPGCVCDILGCGECPCIVPQKVTSPVRAGMNLHYSEHAFIFKVNGHDVSTYDEDTADAIVKALKRDHLFEPLIFAAIRARDLYHDKTKLVSELLEALLAKAQGLL